MSGCFRNRRPDVPVYANWGITRVFNINHHGDPEHNSAIFEAIQRSRKEIGIEAYSLLSDFDTKRFGFTGKEDFIIATEDPYDEGESDYIDIHAGAGETSMMVKYFPDSVDMELTKTLKPTNLTGDDMKEWRRGWDVSRKVTPLGYVGNPAGYGSVSGNMDKFAEVAAGLIEKCIRK